MELSPTDRAYFAGIIDGEGAVMVTRVTDPRYSHGFYFRSVVQVANTRLELLEELNELFPASIQGPYQPKGERSRPVYHYAANGRKARELLESLQPFLRLKARQAELCIELGKLQAGRVPKMKNGRFGPGPQFEPHIFYRMVEIWQEARALNRRGIIPIRSFHKTHTSHQSSSA